MGANIIVNGRTATVIGVDKLYGTDIYASDLRAGAAMIVAALMAEGTAVCEISIISTGDTKNLNISSAPSVPILSASKSLTKSEHCPHIGRNQPINQPIIEQNGLSCFDKKITGPLR